MTKFSFMNYVNFFYAVCLMEPTDIFLGFFRIAGVVDCYYLKGIMEETYGYSNRIYFYCPFHHTCTANKKNNPLPQHRDRESERERQWERQWERQRETVRERQWERERQRERETHTHFLMSIWNCFKCTCPHRFPHNNGDYNVTSYPHIVYYHFLVTDEFTDYLVRSYFRCDQCGDYCDCIDIGSRHFTVII